MKFFNKLERKFGKYAIPNLTRYIIITYGIGYLLWVIQQASSVNILGWLTLDPGLILQGQVWRIVSWVLMPPGAFDIFTLVMLLFYYNIGTVLERVWGDFRYNAYIFFGLIMTVVGSCILYAVMGPWYTIMGWGWMFSTYYVSLSIFLGFAMTFPDQQVLLMFFIPIKMKWLALVDVAYLVYQMIEGNWASRVVILCSLASTIIFFVATRNYSRFNYREQKRKKEFYRAAGYTRVRGSGAASGGRKPIHKCAVCGRAELDDPNLEFRFCSRCNGNYEYCQDHLFNHVHVK